MVETRPLIKTVWDYPTPPKEQWYALGWRPLPAESEWESLGPVLRPHVLYGPMAVTARTVGDGGWFLTNLSHWYPEDAFEPYWMPLPTMPWRRRDA